MIHQMIILGAGPAGISTAVEAIKKGISHEDILILEKFDEVAHMISSKYPEEKAVVANYKNKAADNLSRLHIQDTTKQKFIALMKETVSEYKIKIKYHQVVKKISKLKNGQLSIQTASDTYLTNSVFVAIGTMSNPRTLQVPISETVSDKIFYDIQKIDTINKNILVVGGGDSAAEYAKILFERGFKVSLSYRGAVFEKMLTSNRESILQLIEQEKITFYQATNIQRIDNLDNKPFVYFKEFSEGKEFDAIVTALGSEIPSNYLSTIGIQMGDECNDIFCASNLEGVFFVGDLASKKSGGTINIAFNSGVKAMVEACTSYLDCKIKN